MFQNNKIIFILLTLGIVSCGGGDKPSSTNNLTSNGNVISIPSANPNLDIKDSGVVLSNNAGLYIEKEGKLSWKASAPIATVMKFQNDIRKLKRDDNQERDFAKVTDSDGVEYWIQSVFFAGQAKPGIINLDETVVYKKAEVTSARGIILPKDSLVAYYPDTEKNGFIAISAYIESTSEKTFTKVFIKRENLNTTEKDIQALQLMQIAATTKNEITKKELLKSAALLNSIYTDAINTLLSGQTPAPDRQTESIKETKTINDNNVNVRSKPDENSSKVSELQKDAEVELIEKTVQKYDIPGFGEDYWYKSSNPEGWIFGTFLTN